MKDAAQESASMEMAEPTNAHSSRPGVEALLGKRLILCVGCGGVGKTTTAAAMAAAAAQQHRRAAVITVDPARRLKDALGLDGLGMDPHRVEIAAGAHFDALALDTKRTFDALVQRFAGSEEAASRILSNRLYQELSNELAGSTEYMAMEKLHELIHLRRYQLLVVDTPPSAHVRDLLAAPNRLIGLLASGAIKLLQAPSMLLGRADSAAMRLAFSALLKALERWTGLHLLQDLSDFVSGFEHMVEGFVARAEEVNRLLRAPSTAFVLVTSADSRTVETTISFHRELSAGGYPIAGIIANRVLPFGPLESEEAADDNILPALKRKLQRNYRELRELAQRDELALAHLQAETGAPILAAVPASTQAPTSIAALEQFAAHLLIPPGLTGPADAMSQVPRSFPPPITT